MSDSPFSSMRRAILANKGKRVCRVSTQDRVLLEQAAEGNVKIKIPLPPQARANLQGFPGSFMDFDGVYLVEDPSLKLGEFRFSDLSEG